MADKEQAILELTDFQSEIIGLGFDGVFSKKKKCTGSQPKSPAISKFLPDPKLKLRKEKINHKRIYQPRMGEYKFQTRRP